LSSLSMIAIPSSVRHISHSAFQDCKSLRCVTFELPSQCWCIASDAFHACPQLDWIILPPSVEVIDPTLIEISEHIPRLSAPDNHHFCVENDCFLLSNDRELIHYQGFS
jgi:hypothetical protein